ncbi:hypothetical protein ACHAPO_009191 [Fusarium lateritium]
MTSEFEPQYVSSPFIILGFVYAIRPVVNPSCFRGLLIDMQSSSQRVSTACERCRKQKLKCDIQRPCTLCTRAGVECITSETQKWRFHQPTPEKNPTGRKEPVPKRRRLRTPKNNSPTFTPVSTSIRVGRSSSELPDPSLNLGHNDSAEHTHWNASSTISLIEEAFQHHEVPSPKDTETSSLVARNVHSRQIARQPGSSVAERELSILLPDLSTAKILVDNYFDRIHWFTFLFHQQTFRQRFQRLYSFGTEQHYATNSYIGYVSVFLAVIATSLHYTNVEQKQKLRSFGIDDEILKDKILLVLKSRFLDIISTGSLEVVQMCILLGSYYIYHGQPELAWPLCGTGLRIAQALNLHRETPHKEDDRQIIGDRKRAWWAIYEIETFCSMLYGFPTNISDCDCDVAFLDPYDECSGSVSKGQHVSKPNLLFFKCAMSELSVIVKGTLDNLYRPRSGQGQKNTDYGSRLRKLVDEVESLNQKLVNWNERLDTKLRFDDAAVGNRSNHSLETSDTTFEERLFRLQALSLKLAYENARILIHRPLLSFKLLQKPTADGNDPQSRSDPFQEAMRICRDAALTISKADLKFFQEASETYAVSFIALHLLTAGVALCISITSNPLSKEAYESRMGIRRLMQIQSLLREKSIIAAQGLEITKRLMSLVMAKEVDAMFEFDSSTEAVDSQRPGSSGATRHGDNINAEPIQLLDDMVASQLTECPQSATNDTIFALGTSTIEHDNEADYNLQDFCKNTFLAEAMLEYEQGL